MHCIQKVRVLILRIHYQTGTVKNDSEVSALQRFDLLLIPTIKAQVSTVFDARHGIMFLLLTVFVY